MRRRLMMLNNVSKENIVTFTLAENSSETVELYIKNSDIYEISYTDINDITQSIVDTKVTSESHLLVLTEVKPGSTVILTGDVLELDFYTGNIYVSDIDITKNKTCGLLCRQVVHLQYVFGIDKSTITDIQDRAFLNCTKLELTVLPDTVENIGAYAFSSCTNIELTKLPNNLITIGSNAFNGCRNITINEIPRNVKSIGGRAFNNCTKITNIKILNTELMVTSAGSMFPSGTSIQVPSALLTEYQADSYWNTYTLIPY